MWLNVVTVEGRTFRDFLTSQSMCKFTDYKDDFVCLVWPIRGKLFLQQSSIQKVLPVCKTSCPSAENINETPRCFFFLLEISTQKFQQSGHAGFVSGEVRLLVAWPVCFISRRVISLERYKFILIWRTGSIVLGIAVIVA